MKFTCKTEDLSKALSIVSRAVDTNPPMDVLKNIFIKAENKKISFTATNLDIFISFAIDANIKNEGQITIPAKVLSEYVGLIAEDEIDIESTENLSLSIKTISSKTKIKGILAEEFPSIPKVEKGDAFSILASDFIEGVNQVSFAASTDETRPILTGVFFDANKDSLKIVATDSHRLAEKKLKLSEKIKEDTSAVIPSRTTKEVARIASKFNPEKVLSVNVQKGKFASFKVEGVELISRLVEGKYPDYEKIIPEKQKSVVTVDMEEISRAVRRINIFAKEDKNSIDMDVRKGGIIFLSTGTTEIGEGQAEIPAKKVEGENATVSLNAEYLLHALNAVSSDAVIIELENNDKPVILKKVSKNKDYLHVLMTLK